MIAIGVEQPRGKAELIQIMVSVQHVPRVGDWFEVVSHDRQRVIVAGRVEDVSSGVVLAEGGGQSGEWIRVTLTGWKHGFGKD